MRIKRRDFIKMVSAGILFPWREFFKTNDELEFIVYTNNPSVVLRELTERVEKLSGKRVSLFALNKEAQVVKKIVGRNSAILGSINGVFEVRNTFNSPSGITAIRGGKVFDPRKGEFKDISKKVYSEKTAKTILRVRFGATDSVFGEKGDKAEIFVDGKKIEEINLYKKGEVSFSTNHGKMIISFGDGKVKVKKTMCEHKICKMRGSISSKGEKIVCAPQKVIVKVTGKGFLDAITG